MLPPDTTLTLSLHPVHFVDEILSVLRAEGAELTKRKMAVFRMRCKIVVRGLGCNERRLRFMDPC